MEAIDMLKNYYSQCPNNLACIDDRELIRRCQYGESYLASELLRRYIWLIVAIIMSNSYLMYLDHMYDKDDLFQLASEAFVKAIKGFDLSRGTKFSTFLTRSINNFFINQLKSSNGNVANENIELLKKIDAAKCEFYRKNKRNPEMKELSGILGMTEHKIKKALTEIVCSMVSMSDTLPGSSDITVEDTIANKSTENDDNAINNQTGIFNSLEYLKGKQREVLYMRYHDNMTQEQVAELLGCTHQNVANTEKRGLGKIKKRLEAKGFSYARYHES